ncbi:MAG: hypothetical protein ABI553_02530 [Chloroflexota bacterium]
MTEPTVPTSGNGTTEEPLGLEPTQAEIDEWVAREKRRRQQWLDGPSAEEREAYARQVRQRRLADAFDEGETRIADSVRMGVRYGRETQLAAEGAMTLLYRWGRRTFADLVRSGREWEEETSLPNRRRRVPLDDEDA